MRTRLRLALPLLLAVAACDNAPSTDYPTSETGIFVDVAVDSAGHADATVGLTADNPALLESWTNQYLLRYGLLTRELFTREPLGPPLYQVLPVLRSSSLPEIIGRLPGETVVGPWPGTRIGAVFSSPSPTGHWRPHSDSDSTRSM